MSDTPGLPPVTPTPIDGAVAFLESLRDGRIDRDEFIEAGDASIDTGPFEVVERAAWGLLYDAGAAIASRIDLGKVRLFSKRTPAELRADADEAEAEGNLDKAERLRARADRREEG